MLFQQWRHVNLGAGDFYDRPFLGDLFPSSQAHLLAAEPRQVLRNERLPVGDHQKHPGVLDSRCRVSRRQRQHHGSRVELWTTN